MPDTDLLDTYAAAERLGVTATALIAWRARHRGPRYVRISTGPRGTVRYRVSDLNAYVTANVVDPTES